MARDHVMPTGELQTFRPGQMPVLTKVTEGAEQTLERRAQVDLVKSDASRNLKRVNDESAEMKRRKERPWNSSSVQ